MEHGETAGCQTNRSVRGLLFYMSERFETMTVIELRDYAREHHIPLPAGINKQGIIDKLKASVQPEAAAEESGTPAKEPQAPAPAARPRTASIIADDSDYDYEDGDLSYRQPPRVTPQPTYTQRPAAAAPARPAEPARPAAAKPDVLSTISSKAPAFNIDGVRAWHNPKSFQQGGSYNQGGYQQSSGRQGYSKPAQGPMAGQYQDQRPTQTRPGVQPVGAAQEMPVRMEGQSYGTDSRYLKDFSAVQKTTLPELLAEGEFVDQQGVLSIDKNGSGLMIDERHPRRSRPVYISHTQIRRYALREGDLIAGKTKTIRGAKGRRLMVYLEKVNGEPAEDVKDRPDFLGLDVAAPKTPIALESSRRSALRFGHRALLILNGEEDGRALITRLAGEIQKENEDVACFLLSLGQSPEEGHTFMEQAPCPCLAVDAAVELEQQVGEVRYMLERAKRLAENGRRAVLLVDSLTAVAELAEEALTPQRAIAFFGTGRALKNGGSVTIIGLVRESDTELPCIKRIQRYASLTLRADQV